jgi:hypothetical protein
MNLKLLSKRCGVYPIAQHMKKQGYPLYMAVHLLARKHLTK